MANPNLAPGSAGSNISDLLGGITARLDPKYMADAEKQGLDLQRIRREEANTQALQDLIGSNALSLDEYGTYQIHPDFAKQVGKLLIGSSNDAGQNAVRLNALLNSLGTRGLVGELRAKHDYGETKLGPNENLIPGPKLPPRISPKGNVRTSPRSGVVPSVEPTIPAEGSQGALSLIVGSGMGDLGGEVPAPKNTPYVNEYGGISTPPAPRHLPSEALKPIASNLSLGNAILDVIGQLQKTPDAKSVPLGVVRSIPFIGDPIVDAMVPQSVAPLAALGKLKSEQLHQAFGGAQTLSEMRTAQPYLPGNLDSTRTSITKLIELARNVQRENQSLSSLHRDTGELPPDTLNKMNAFAEQLQALQNAYSPGASKGKKTIAQVEAEARQTQAAPKFASEDEAAQYFASKYPSRAEAKKAYEDYMKGRK